MGKIKVWNWIGVNLLGYSKLTSFVNKQVLFTA
jgi:hypothetical protein